MENFETCPYEYNCINNDRCYMCNEGSMYKTDVKPWGKPKKKKGFVNESVNAKVANADDSWKDLEQKVADSLNDIPDIQSARRSIRSGALWFETGDIVDDILHPECKEREGRELKSGDRSMSIQKLWLEKAAEECKSSNKVMCLPFRFKGDSKIYTIFEHNDIAELITLMKAYIHDNELKDQEIKALQKTIEELKDELKNSRTSK